MKKVLIVLGLFAGALLLSFIPACVITILYDCSTSVKEFLDFVHLGNCGILGYWCICMLFACLKPVSISNKNNGK